MLTNALAAAGFYVALFIIGNVVLQTRIIKLRRSRLIGVGHGHDHELERAVRVHANYVENVPFALAALILLALTGSPVWPVHLVGALVVLGRMAHAVGLSRSSGKSQGRVIGMMVTICGLLLGAAILLYRAIF